MYIGARVIEGRWRGCEWRMGNGRGGVKRGSAGRGGREDRLGGKFDLSAITIGDWTLTGSCASCGDA